VQDSAGYILVSLEIESDWGVRTHLDGDGALHTYHPYQNIPIGIKIDAKHVRYNLLSGFHGTSPPCANSFVLTARSMNRLSPVAMIEPTHIAANTAPLCARLKSWRLPKTRGMLEKDM
jgi:hypothetical protein